MKQKYTLEENIIQASKAVFLSDPYFEKEDWVLLANQFTNIITPSEQHLLLNPQN